MRQVGDCGGMETTFTLGGQAFGLAGLALVAAAFFLAGLVKGAAAFGVPIITLPLLVHLMPVPTAAALVIIPAIVSNIVQAAQSREAAGVLRVIWPLLAALAVALALSVRLIQVLDAAALYLLIGLLIEAFVILQASGRIPPVSAAARKPLLVASGLIGGVVGGATSFYAFPALQLMLALGMTPVQFAFATSIMFICGSSVLGLGFATIGTLGSGELALSIAAIAPLMVGLWLGQAIVRRVSVVWFKRFVLVLMVFMGLSMIRRGLGL